MPNQTQSFIVKNWTILLWVVTANFVAGGLYAEFQYLQSSINVVDQRVNKKIEVINKIQKRLIKIEHHIEYEKGYKDAKKDK